MGLTAVVVAACRGAVPTSWSAAAFGQFTVGDPDGWSATVAFGEHIDGSPVGEEDRLPAYCAGRTALNARVLELADRLPTGLATPWVRWYRASKAAGSAA